MRGVRPEELAALQAGGLYDPAAPGAAEQLALLEWLAAQAVTVEQMVEAKRGGSTITGLAGDLVLRPPEERLTLRQAAELAGMTPARLEQVRQAAGLPPIDPSDRLFSRDDTAVFATFARAADLFGEAAMLQFIRAVGSSLARIAEAAVSLFLVNIEGPIIDAQKSELALAQANLLAMRALQLIPPLMQSVLRAHMETAIRRMRAARDEHSVDLMRMAVGFIDLVGFTSLSRKLTPRELADVMAQFEALAHDVIVARDGRLVKLIGDEVMFVAVDVAAACDVALTLVERFAGDPAVTPRAGLAAGPLLMRSGDYYGPIVNLASRIAELAVPQEVLVTAEVAAQAASSQLRFEPAGKRMLKGFDEPFLLYAAQRG
jgi:class 3 adenylate cyclase